MYAKEIPSEMHDYSQKKITPKKQPEDELTNKRSTFEDEESKDEQNESIYSNEMASVQNVQEFCL